MVRHTTPLTLLALALFAGGCIGDIGDGGAANVPSEVAAEEASTAIPRLSRRELDATLFDVFGIAGAALQYLPPDPDLATNPESSAEQEVFDTLAASKTPSQVFVEGLEALAFAVGRDVAADPARVNALSGCVPAAPTDEVCLAQLAQNVGLRLWRRPLQPDELQTLVTSAAGLATDPAAGSNGFYVAARAVISSLVASPEFVYRTEIGSPLGQGVMVLDDLELVSRLAYFLWGTTPTPELLARAQAGGLSGPGGAELEKLVDEMLGDPRAGQQMKAFHELWLRYNRLLVSDEALATDMRGETEALVGRALEPANWAALVSSRETYVTPALATHYGLDGAANIDGAAWVAYPEGRAGLLSHGSFLSLSQTKQTETLPSRRGAMIGRRLLCEVILPPPPDVAADMGVPVPPDSCKSDAYIAHASGGCKACHVLTDGIGFGFERFDGVGRYREVESENPSCSIDGMGTAKGQSFSGPAQFSDQNLDLIATCAADHLLRFATRDWAPSQAWLKRAEAAFLDSGRDFRGLMRSIALDPVFRHRVQETP